jgi:hypothetical protein
MASGPAGSTGHHPQFFEGYLGRAPLETRERHWTAPFAGTIERLEDAGIRFFTWADLEGTADQKRMLYQLYIDAEKDVPADDPYHPPPPEQFQKDILESPAFLSQGLIIAADGSQWVGVTQMLSGDGEVVYHGFTGVLREHRGRNIAVALKLLSIGACQRLQVKQVKTSNDSRNLPMLAINRKLGYTSEPGAYVMRVVHSPYSAPHVTFRNTGPAHAL